MKLIDIRNKVIVFSSILLIFLPIRLLFYHYISPHWIGGLGLVSLFMFGILYLSHKKKLGWFGSMFIEQMNKTVKGRPGKIIVIFCIILISYFGLSLLWIDEGNTTYLDKKNVIHKLIFSNISLSDTESKTIDFLHFEQGDIFSDAIYFNQMISAIYAIMNDAAGGWLTNLNTVMLLENFDLLGFMIFYRKIYLGNQK